MSTEIIDEFFQRKKQVWHYIAVVAVAERVAERSKARRSQETRLLTLRSGTFLVLYNLIESSLRASIEAIHDQIIREQVPFEMLNPTLRKEVLRLFRADTKSTLHEQPDNFPSALVAAALSQEFKLSGNVDARLIKALGLVYGFSTTTDKAVTWDGSDLLTVKSNRNDLAHGRKSYEEVGRNYPLRDLMNISRRTTMYVGAVVANISHYIMQKSYNVSKLHD